MARIDRIHSGKKRLKPINKERIYKAAGAKASGVSNLNAAAAAGISLSLFDQWLKRGREEERRGITEEESLYVLFVVSIREALASLETRHVEIISRAAQLGDWRASKFILDRRMFRHWSKDADVEAGPDDAVDEQVSSTGDQVTLEQLRDKIFGTMNED